MKTGLNNKFFINFINNKKKESKIKCMKLIKNKKKHLKIKNQKKV